MAYVECQDILTNTIVSQVLGKGQIRVVIIGKIQTLIVINTSRRQNYPKIASLLSTVLPRVFSAFAVKKEFAV